MKYLRKIEGELYESIVDIDLDQIERDIELIEKMQRENPVALSDHYYKGTKLDVETERQSDSDENLQFA